MTKNTALTTLAVILVALAVGVRHQVSALYAQATFAGATLITNEYYNCIPGKDGCEPQVRTIHTFGPDHSVSEFRYWIPADKRASDPLMGDVFAANGDSTHIMGAVGEVYTIRYKNHPLVNSKINLSGDCQEFASQGQTKTGLTEDVKGFRSVVYQLSGMEHMTVDYIPDLGCVSFVAKSVSTHGPYTTSVVVDAHAGFDPVRLAMTPAGMSEVAPSVAYKDSSAKSLSLQGYSPQQISDMWVKSLAHSPLNSHDAAWKAGLGAK